MPRMTKCQLEAAMPFLDVLPDPVLWIGHDYTLSWRNLKAKEQYGEGEGKCFTLTHGRTAPCNEDGEFCPMQKAENEQHPVSVVHAHKGRTAEPFLYRVLAVPIDGGGVLEIHHKLDGGLVHDELTGLYRREFWNEIVRRDLALLSRLNRPYALLFVDLDRFKTFNDEHGHPTGDRLLRRLGSAISQHIRTSDAACRYGGEEFVLFLPNTSMSRAMRLAERIRSETRHVKVETREGPGSVTASIGVHGASPRELLLDALQKADDALYLAKQAGRDRVCAWSTTTAGPGESIDH